MTINKSEKECKDEIDKYAARKIKYGDLPNYLNDVQFLSSLTPGPGYYNERCKESF